MSLLSKSLLLVCQETVQS